MGRSVYVMNYLLLTLWWRKQWKMRAFQDRTRVWCVCTGCLLQSLHLCYTCVCVFACVHACACMVCFTKGMMSFHLCQSCSLKNSSWNDNCRSASLFRHVGYFSIIMLMNCVELSVNSGLIRDLLKSVIACLLLPPCEADAVFPVVQTRS